MMTENRPTSRRMAGRLLKNLALVVGLALCLLISPVSADEIIIDENISEYVDTSYPSKKPSFGTSYKNLHAISTLLFNDVSKARSFGYVVLEADTNNLGYSDKSCTNQYAPGRYNITYTYNGVVKPGVLYVFKYYNLAGAVTKTRLQIFLNEWDIGSDSGKKSVPLSFGIGRYESYGIASEETLNIGVGEDFVFGTLPCIKALNFKIAYATADPWKNRVTVIRDTANPIGAYNVKLDRTIDGRAYKSQFGVYYNDSVLYSRTATGVNLDLWYDSLTKVNVTSPSGRSYDYLISTPGDPAPDTDSAPVTVYVLNSQTGALLADAHLSILAAAGDPVQLVEVVNATLPGGTGIYTLQPTGPTNPNPRYYQAVATVPGFTQIIENHSFTLTGPHDVIIEMRPDTGGPLDPDRAYLEFYVRDIHANPLPSASVQCDGRIKTTNSQGYAVFEVSKNASYPWIAQKSGYVKIEGTATVADGPRYVVNVVLGPSTVPTYTPATPGPGETPGVPGATPGPGETPGVPGATPTPDRRTNEQKGQAVIDTIADFAYPIALLAILATVMGIMNMLLPGRRR